MTANDEGPEIPKDIDWTDWDDALRTRGAVIDCPRDTSRPRFLTTVYPVDYGYVPDTVGDGGMPVDVFIGSDPERGLVGIIATHDALKGDDEIKLLGGTTEAEIGAILAFLNRGGMTGRLILRLTDPILFL